MPDKVLEPPQLDEHDEAVLGELIVKYGWRAVFHNLHEHVSKTEFWNKEVDYGKPDLESEPDNRFNSNKPPNRLF